MPRTRRVRQSLDVEFEDTKTKRMAAMFAALPELNLRANEQILFMFTASTGKGNFISCTARFTGSKGEDLKTFIDAVTVYKECACVLYFNAVRCLSMLLIDKATIWRRIVKPEIYRWVSSIDYLRSACGERQPPFIIYLQLFSWRHGNQWTDIFVASVCALLNKLPAGKLSEKI